MEDWEKTLLATPQTSNDGRPGVAQANPAEDDSTRLMTTDPALLGPTVALPLPPSLERENVANTLPAGFRLQEYRIDAVLGQGGFGITYLATDTNLHAEVAIKEYLPSQLAVRTGDRTVRPRFADQEALLQEGLEHFLEEARTLATFR
ncbi:MAG: hypothetical protein WBP72_10255, partial [Rhodocyclaceae bacterium]